MLFTDYYAEATCTAGRANFITGMLPVRSGLTTVGQAGATVGIPAEAPTIATALARRATPPASSARTTWATSTGICLPARLRRVFRLPLPPRRHGGSVLAPYRRRCRTRSVRATSSARTATDTEDATEQPRWGKVGKQRIVDEGPLPPQPMPGIQYNMETYDEVVRDKTIGFIDKAVEATSRSSPG